MSTHGPLRRIPTVSQFMPSKFRAKVKPGKAKGGENVTATSKIKGQNRTDELSSKIFKQSNKENIKTTKKENIIAKRRLSSNKNKTFQKNKTFTENAVVSSKTMEKNNKLFQQIKENLSQDEMRDILQGKMTTVETKSTEDKQLNKDWFNRSERRGNKLLEKIKSNLSTNEIIKILKGEVTKVEVKTEQDKQLNKEWDLNNILEELGPTPDLPDIKLPPQRPTGPTPDLPKDIKLPTMPSEAKGQTPLKKITDVMPLQDLKFEHSDLKLVKPSELEIKYSPLYSPELTPKEEARYTKIVNTPLPTNKQKMEKWALETKMRRTGGETPSPGYIDKGTTKEFTPRTAQPGGYIKAPHGESVAQKTTEELIKEMKGRGPLPKPDLSGLTKAQRAKIEEKSVEADLQQIYEGVSQRTFNEKGSLVLIGGRLTPGTWEPKNGVDENSKEAIKTLLDQATKGLEAGHLTFKESAKSKKQIPLHHLLRTVITSKWGKAVLKKNKALAKRARKFRSEAQERQLSSRVFKDMKVKVPSKVKTMAETFKFLSSEGKTAKLIASLQNVYKGSNRTSSKLKLLDGPKSYLGSLKMDTLTEDEKNAVKQIAKFAQEAHLSRLKEAGKKIGKNADAKTILKKDSIYKSLNEILGQCTGLIGEYSTRHPEL